MDIDKLIEKSKFYRNIHAWPLSSVLNYKGWLDNFSDLEEKKIASSILDFFIYIPESMIKQMLKTVIGYCGEIIKSHFSDWKHDDFINKCVFSYIPGETINPTDSGHVYLRYLRDDLYIPENHISDFNSLFSLLANTSTPTPVIFVDDFVGSGAQCIKAWNGNEEAQGEYILKILAKKTNHVFIYAPLVVNHIGHLRIKIYCDGLNIIPCHVLGDEYNLFSSDCICWNNEQDLYLRGTELILSKSKTLGIPFTNGKSVNDVRGFNEQGLAIAFANGAPDAIPAFFYWCDNNWTPLINKVYKR